MPLKMRGKHINDNYVIYAKGRGVWMIEAKLKG